MDRRWWLFTATLVASLMAPPLAHSSEEKAQQYSPDADGRYREAVCYARVLDIPAPRWSRYDAARFGTALPAEALRTTQERAYRSAIWYPLE